LIALIPNIVDDVKADTEKKLTGKNMHKKYKNEFTAIKGIVYSFFIDFILS